VVATLVIGSDGSSAIEGNSASVTSPADRENFLRRRRMVDCIIIGGNTASSEPYAKTPVPLVIVSRFTHPDLPKAHVWNCTPEEAIRRATKEFGGNVLIEAGPSFISNLIDHGVIDVLELSETSNSGGTNYFDKSKYLSLASSVDEKTVDGTIFYTAYFKKQK
jgi:riboflavin biosynthesis pyrimidine reductase